MIRDLVLEDIEAIVKLETSTLGTTLGHELLKSYITHSFAKVLVLEIDNKIIGYISSMFDGEVVEIENFCIDLGYQGLGYGKLLLGYLINYFNFKAKSFYLEVRSSNFKAINLYNYFDFKQIHIRKNYYDTEDALVLERKVFTYYEFNDYILNTFCKIEHHDIYDIYFDINNPHRYSQNFYMIKDFNKFMSLEIYKTLSRLPHTVCNYMGEGDIIPNLEISKLLIMYSTISSISYLKNTNKKIKILTTKDIAILSKYLYNSSICYSSQYASDNLKQVLEYFDKGFYNYSAYIVNNKIEGILRFMIYNKCLFIEDFEVSVPFQHQGVGSSLIKQTIEHAKKMGCYQVYLLADIKETYQDMYQKMGFIKGDIFTEYIG